MRYTPSGAARVARSRLLLMLPWTRRAEMDRLINLVALQHQVTMAQAFALMWQHAAPHEQDLLEPYRPAPDDIRTPFIDAVLERRDRLHADPSDVSPFPPAGGGR